MIKSTKSFLTALVGIAVVGAALSYNPAPAQAATCLYQAFDRFANRTVHQIKGEGRAARTSRACKRARRRCLRALRKAWDRGMAQRAGCVRFVGRVPQL